MHVAPDHRPLTHHPARRAAAHHLFIARHVQPATTAAAAAVAAARAARDEAEATARAALRCLCVHGQAQRMDELPGCLHVDAAVLDLVLDDGAGPAGLADGPAAETEQEGCIARKEG